ncbi:C4-dicarboxylate TRAP transporter substrate-binding protein [Marinobacter sp. SS21]|uniref:C4-dicarboxylate TRAP transporter substrate-binding protein n=1 Tax=Marinobacter sp. SS21 TaxID=2979460 RepID=UPI00232AD854|nr:C4-dicarboxylate TRAP transporter substrate-binding protein [Marinobacter sp. SS21]MDC0662973.1 C4-dicarboxylate TRAP transporter substrate-binding protein [Marinobacter sp. SS21]
MKHQLKSWLLVGLLGLAGAAQASAELVLRFAEGSPNRGTRAQAVQYFADEVARLSDGAMKVEIHWGGALLKFSGIMDGVASGTADIGTVLSAYNPSKLSSLSIGDIPLETSDPWVGMRAMYELLTTEPQLQSSLAEQDLVYLSNFSTSGVQFECTQGNEIRTVADIAGKRMRASATYAKVLDDLGANMVNMTYGKVYQALDSGLVDCLASYFYTMRAYKTYEVVESVTRVDWGQLMGFAIVFNKFLWDDLTDAQQQVLQEAGSRMVDHFAQLQLEEIHQVADALPAGDFGPVVRVVDIAPSEREAIIEASRKYRDLWIEQANAQGLDGQQIWQHYASLLEKYQALRAESGYPWDS